MRASAEDDQCAAHRFTGLLHARNVSGRLVMKAACNGGNDTSGWHYNHVRWRANASGIGCWVRAMQCRGLVSGAKFGIHYIASAAVAEDLRLLEAPTPKVARQVSTEQRVKAVLVLFPFLPA